jgi:hypothetical protein
MKHGQGYVRIEHHRLDMKKQTFDNRWHSYWFASNGAMRKGGMYRSSNDIQSMHRLMYMAIDYMEDVLTMPE